jgi:hypothetical protein
LGYYPPPWQQEGPSAIKYPAKGLYPKLLKEGYDLHELHALMAPRPFLVSGGSEDSVDRWIPLNHTIEVNRLLGFENRVGMTNRPDHTPTLESNEILCLFFEYFLKYGGLDKKGQCGQKWLVNSPETCAGINLHRHNHKMVYDCKKMSKKAVTIVAAF